jgi:very-short-patch-repair endonuclease
MRDPFQDLLTHQDAVVHIDQALLHLSRKTVRHRVSSGRWHLAHRSVVVAHNGPVTVAQRRWIAVLAVPGGVLGGMTAAQAAGLTGHGGPEIHVVAPSGCRATAPPGVFLHRATVLDDRDLLAAGRPPRTRSARSLVDAAQWARSDDQARMVIAAGFQQRLVRADDLRAVLDRLPRARRRKLIAQTVADAAGGAHSVPELDFLDLCRRHRLPEPTRQVVRRDSAGRRRYLDAYFEEWQVHVEVDGGQHLDPQQAWDDMQRQNDLWISGDRVLRFPAWAVRTRPDEVIAQVRTALMAAGWVPRDLGKKWPP